jgi:hypothetical protein
MAPCTPERHAVRSLSRIVALAACSACATAPPNEPPNDVVIEIRTLERAGASLPFIPISAVIAWHGTTQLFLARGLVLSDSAGILLLHDTLSPVLGLLDSLEVQFPSYPCPPTAPADTVLRATGITVSLTLWLDVAAPSLAPGEYCGLGSLAGSPTSGSPFTTHLQIDSLTDSIRGVWRIVYFAPIATQGGSFSGAVLGGRVELHLESTPVPHCVPRYRLVAALSSDTKLGVAYLEPAGGCSTVIAPPFRFILYDDPDFP